MSNQIITKILLPISSRKGLINLIIISSLIVIPAFSWADDPYTIAYKRLSNDFKIRIMNTTTIFTEMALNKSLKDDGGIVKVNCDEPKITEMRNEFSKIFVDIDKISNLHNTISDRYFSPETKMEISADSAKSMIDGTMVLYFKMADLYMQSGCMDIAEEEYKQVINTLIGSSYTAYRQRAQIALESIREERNKSVHRKWW